MKETKKALVMIAACKVCFWGMDWTRRKRSVSVIESSSPWYRYILPKKDVIGSRPKTSAIKRTRVNAKTSIVSLSSGFRKTWGFFNSRGRERRESIPTLSIKAINLGNSYGFGKEGITRSGKIQRNKNNPLDSCTRIILS